MKSTFLKINLIITCALLINGAPSMADTDNAQKVTPTDKGAKQETTTQPPEEKIRQLEAQIKEQQEEVGLM